MIESVMGVIHYAQAAADIAIDRIKRENLLPGYNFESIIGMDNCDESESTGQTVELIRRKNVDVIFGPNTNLAGYPAFAIATYYNLPIISWGLTSDSEFDNIVRYPTTALMSTTSRGLVMAFRKVMQQFNWNQFVYGYSLIEEDDKCLPLRNNLQAMVGKYADMTLSFTYQITDDSEEGILKALEQLSKRGRIIVVCFPEGNMKGIHRRLTMLAYENGYATDEYVYIFPALRSKGYVVPNKDGTTRPPWVLESGPSEKDESSRKGFLKTIFICDMQGQGQQTGNYSVFNQEVIERMGKPPYNCIEECSDVEFKTAATYSGQLHDSVYAYGRTLSKILQESPENYRNGTHFVKNFQQNFTGISGPVTINSHGTRNPTLYVLTLDENSSSSIIATVLVTEVDGFITNRYVDEGTALWHSRANRQRPPDEPVCGFTGLNCKPSVFFEYLGWFITAIIIVVIAILGALAACVITIRTKRMEGKTDQSMHSLSSGPSTISSSKSGVSFEAAEKRHYLFMTIQNGMELERVAARKHNVRPIFDKHECAEMRQHLQVDHANLNKFIGLSLDGPQLLSVWRYCSRGSLADVIRKATIQMDGFFIYSLMKDIVTGISYLHNSPIAHHGMLTSKNCLLSDRWQMKISEFGIRKFRINDQYSKNDFLWTAPEHLRNDNLDGSKEGDIYSFGIISAELVTRKSVFDIENRKEDAEELLYLIKKGGMKAPRPDLEFEEAMEINPALLHLIRDCWTERPSERPTIREVYSQLRGMNNNRNDNLMDHVFNVLESYASTLEDEVSERMKELVEEKKKSDVLLYRMLPKQVADKLKLGQTVEPETFDMVTLFFSDVVSFTTLASKCTPLQVVNLLNDLYTIFDSIIDQHDVYKVETIGDGYLCVSGLPHRNGKEHVRHIASMSLLFVGALDNFRVPHLPTEQIRIRVGFHSGSVVAGVVGLTMPRYCLFGDAVNTASRMESNSKPGKVHISSEANQLLTELGGFITEPRGEVIVKGKGVMQTYWLLSMLEHGAPKLKET
ncbi:unnamed protein product [Caenorhabditis bovis]|uniref:Guanylate cyclase n=2 Tax=Caenorhabditis bovis TaxID=2654633 RepID=A0A8S1E9J5_9PELO|nr:unnamed protein product [Caenorhabditis bovis]